MLHDNKTSVFCSSSGNSHVIISSTINCLGNDMCYWKFPSRWDCQNIDLKYRKKKIPYFVAGVHQNIIYWSVNISSHYRSVWNRFKMEKVYIYFGVYFACLRQQQQCYSKNRFFKNVLEYFKIKFPLRYR